MTQINIRVPLILNCMNILPHDDVRSLQQSVVDAVCEYVTQTLATQDLFSVSLSGGSTPKRIYELLAERDLPWDRIHLFWGDERNVPHEHDDSNLKMVTQALLKSAAVPQANFHPVPVNVGDPASTAKAYEETLRAFFADQPHPKWDLMLLGMGDDAHTASLFPGTQAILETDRWFVENFVEKHAGYRYTLTAPAINSAQEIWFLVSGENKRDALKHVWGQKKSVSEYPSQLITPSRWYVTRDAMV